MSQVSRAIPTLYKGVQFRSRAEATAAAFFDALKWEWAYEPVDLDGYIPDFLLRFPAGDVLAEVKAAMFLEELAEAAPKIQRSGWSKEYLIIGGTLFRGSWFGPVIGLIGERDDGEWVPPDNAESFFCTACERVSFHSASGGYRCRVCGADDRKHRGSAGDDVARAWTQASNATQWKGPAATP